MVFRMPYQNWVSASALRGPTATSSRWAPSSSTLATSSRGCLCSSARRRAWPGREHRSCPRSCPASTSKGPGLRKLPASSSASGVVARAHLQPDRDPRRSLPAHLRRPRRAADEGHLDVLVAGERATIAQHRAESRPAPVETATPGRDEASLSLPGSAADGLRPGRRRPRGVDPARSPWAHVGRSIASCHRTRARIAAVTRRRRHLPG